MALVSVWAGVCMGMCMGANVEWVFLQDAQTLSVAFCIVI